jgi:hypothetical protein
MEKVARIDMRSALVLGLFALSACTSSGETKPGVAASSPAEAVSTVASGQISTVTPVQPESKNCREFTVPIKVGNEEKQAYGRACEQPDGSWQIVQPNGAQPPTIIEHTNIYPAYPYWGPPWWGPYWGFGGVVVVRHGHHHHHHHH